MGPMLLLLYAGETRLSLTRWVKQPVHPISSLKSVSQRTSAIAGDPKTSETASAMSGFLK